MFRNEQRRVTLTPLPGSKVIVNGNAISQTTELQHLVGLSTDTDFMICLFDVLLKNTQDIFLSLFFLPLGPSHSRFQLHLPIHWLSVREGWG